jgi:hypothetical protein
MFTMRAIAKLVLLVSMSKSAQVSLFEMPVTDRISRFMTDFCPYESGIIDIICQYLLPAISGDLEPLPSRSKIAIKHRLTDAQEERIHWAIRQQTRIRGDFINSGDIGACLEALKVLPLPPNEKLDDIVTSLDKSGSGMTEKAEFVNVAARLLSAKLRAEPEKNDGLGPPDLRKKMMSRGIRAELYKLNAYSAPSGHFKPHVDTPRSDTQIGSLVVCLPTAFRRRRSRSAPFRSRGHVQMGDRSTRCHPLGGFLQRLRA